ncbi:hypothetical protein H4R35_006757 [Dimargaris xerosporica]|nr:hypothetical protein H4R35_006757 [Dimargaris xerosporica]
MYEAFGVADDDDDDEFDDLNDGSTLANPNGDSRSSSNGKGSSPHGGTSEPSEGQVLFEIASDIDEDDDHDADPPTTH